ncbi:MAG: hypothetical protein ACK59A_05470 [Cyanobacteriota bacterium]
MLLILGALTLASRSTNSYLTASKQSDAQAARQAAESGMNRVMGMLNPYAKFSTDPYLSFLLATRWEPGTGVSYTTISGVPSASSGWSLTTMGKSQVQGLLAQCGFSIRGQHPLQVPPDNQQVYRDLLSASIGIEGSVSRTQLFYRVTNYVPPERPAMATTVAWPTECQAFTTAAGGSAQISVEGLVVRRGRLMARHTITRTFDVQGWPFPNLPASWLTQQVKPGPPTSLRIGGDGFALGRMMTPVTYANFTSSTTTSALLVNSSQPQCFNCSTTNPPISSVQGSISLSDVIPEGDPDLPIFPFNTDSIPAGITSALISNNLLNYPYKADGTLRSECALSEAVQSGRPNEIDCWIEGVGPASVDRIDVIDDQVPLTLTRNHQVVGGEYILVNIPTGPSAFRFDNVGNIRITSIPSPNQITFTDPTPSSEHSEGSQHDYSDSQSSQTRVDLSSAGAPTVKQNLNLYVNTQSRPVNLIITGSVGESSLPTILRHMVTSTQPFDHSNPSSRFLWNRLRLFGRKPTTGSCSVDQTFHIRSEATGTTSSLNGAFVWLPRGHLSYGVAGDTTPQELLGSWWVCNLTTNLSQPMSFIMPLYGNPDALTPILPGGYLSASGFIPDLRFPVYPSLQRIRSAF